MADQNLNLRILSMDGGGVRGLSSLFLLEHLLKKVNHDDPPLPCNFFHMIGGTSTGGLIAIMLGKLRMSVQECIDAYVEMMDDIFKDKNIPVDWRGRVKGKFKASVLEDCIRKLVQRAGLPEDAKMRTPGETPHCKVFVCAVSEQASQQVQFCNYRREGETSLGGLYDNVTILEAARATSAATTFFEPVSIGKLGQTFIDGATGQNNPVEQTWHEARKLWGDHDDAVLRDNLQCLVSIGTGVPEIHAFGRKFQAVGKSLIAIATDTEHKAEWFAANHEQLADQRRYVRLNVTRGLGSIGLEDNKRKHDLAAATQVYCDEGETKRMLNGWATNVTLSES